MRRTLEVRRTFTINPQNSMLGSSYLIFSREHNPEQTSYNHPDSQNARSKISGRIAFQNAFPPIPGNLNTAIQADR